MHKQHGSPEGAAPRLRRRWAIALMIAAASLLVLVAHPAWAADGTHKIEQGTVPPPTPRPTVESGSGGGSDNEDTSEPTATPAAEATAEATAGATAEATAAPATGALTAAVNAVTLNVREGPGTDYAVVGKLPQGTTVTVEGRNEAGDWLVICCVPNSETRGWVSGGLVTPNYTTEQAGALPVVAAPAAPAATPSPTAAAATATPAGQQGSVTAVTLNVRSAPSTTATVVGKLREGDAVGVQGRNEAGDWLFVCCVPNTQTSGWVSAQYVSPSFAAADLPVTAGSETATAPAATGSVTGTETTGTAGTGETGASDPLAVTVTQQPPFAVQGKEIVLLYSVRNNTAEPAANVVLSSTLPGPFTLVGVGATGGTVAQGTEGANQVSVTWPTLAAGEAVTAVARVRVAPDVPNGTTFPQLASVTADGGLTGTGGITIGMPPSLLPEFW